MIMRRPRDLWPFFVSLFIGQLAIGQTTFHGDIARTGVYNSPGPKVLGAPEWVFQTKGPIYGSPAVSDGVVYIGSADGALYAVDQKTGQQKWRFATDGQVVSSPAAADGMLFFLSYDGVFYALDAKTGERRWRFATTFERRFEAKNLHGQSPAGQTLPDAYAIFL